MLWVIIVAVILVVVLVGCAVAFCYGKYSGSKMHTVRIGARIGQAGRPAMRPTIRRQISPEEEQRRAELTAANLQNLPQGDSSARVEDVRLQPWRERDLIGIGMAVERQMSHRGAGDIAERLDGLQGAIDEVRDRLSPRAEAASVANTRIRASASLE